MVVPTNRPIWRTALWAVVKAVMILVLGTGAGLAYNHYSNNGIPLETPERVSRTDQMDWKLYVSGHRATLDEVREAVDKGTAVLVDARSERAYAAGHIPGALSLPIRDFARRRTEVLAGIPKGTAIIAYCSGGT